MRRDTNSDGTLDTEYFYRTDDMYNVVAVTNASGAVVERYEYGPYGAPKFFNGAGAPLADSAIDNPYLWNGRRYDPETGLYYYRLRYLDPELGRFTTLDPIGLWGDAGNMGNGYAYVGNRPWAALDPFGLWSWEGFWHGIKAVPHAIVEPLTLTADIALTAGIAFENATTSNHIYIEDVHFSSGTANRLKQNVIEGRGFFDNARAATVVATAMPTVGLVVSSCFCKLALTWEHVLCKFGFSRPHPMGWGLLF